MAQPVSVGEELLVKAAKKANTKPGFFGSMMGRSEARFEEAFEMCEEAANIFKMNKRWDLSGDAYVLAAEMQEKLGVKHEAATCYVNAAKMMKKTDAKGSIVPLEKAATRFAELSRFNFASKYSIEIGEILENDVVDLEAAMEKYEAAADYAQMDGAAETTMAKANGKVAKLAAQLEKYDRAIELYEEIANSYVEKDLLKFSCKEFYLKAGLCQLASGDAEGAKIKLEWYEQNAAYFRDSREAKLIAALGLAIENEDEDEFTGVVKEYDTVSKLDDWMTMILLRIKKGMTDLT